MLVKPALERLAKFVAVQEGKTLDQSRREAGYAVDLFSAILELTSDDHGPTPTPQSPRDGDQPRRDLHPRQF